MTSKSSKNETFLKEATDSAKKSFPQFWADSSATNLESRENTIDCFYEVIKKTHETCDTAGIIGPERKLHLFSSNHYVKSEFQFHLMKQEMDLLRKKNEELEARLSALEPKKIRKTK
jgi:hypothetical protein